MIVNNVTTNSGLNVSELMTECFNSINTAGTDLSERIKGLIGLGDELDQGTMLQVQFEVGQYNAMLEMVSTVSKSLTDMMKTLAQRSS